MNILKRTALCVVVATAVCANAAAPVAVRVEIETLEVEAGGTNVLLTVQVSPEDRSRIGKNAMVRVELDGDVPPGQSPMWAVRIEGDGSGRIETVWPPGEHALRVEIASPSGEHTGLWVGTVRIPGAEAEAPVEELVPLAPESPPAAVEEPEDTQAMAEAGAVAESEDEQLLAAETALVATEIVEESMEEQPIQETDPGSADDLVEDSTQEPPRQADTDVAAVAEPPVESAPVEIDVVEEVEAGEPGLDAETLVGTAAAAGSSTGAAPTEPGMSVEKPEAPESAASSAETEQVTVEPLRGESPRPETVPDMVAAPTEPEARSQAPEPPPADVAAALESWSEADPATADLTVVVYRNDEAAAGLSASDFTLRVGGKEAVIEEVGGRDRAPLQLGIAVDAATDTGAGWAHSGGRLFSLVQRARAGRGHVFFAADGRVGAWDGDPADSRGGAGSTSTGGLTSLIVDSLGRFEGRRGRSFLVVVTDGRSDADKGAWKRSIDAAANAGVPVLVIALWDDNFSHRVRKNLKSIADASGGGLFLVQGSDQLDRAAERFGPMIDAGTALRFFVPPGVVLPASVSINTSDKDLEVSAPKGVR